MNRNPMTEESLIELCTIAANCPELLGKLTAGQLCERYGVPDREQWDCIMELLQMDVTGHFRSRVPQSLAVAC